MEPILEVKGLSIAFQQYDAGTRQRRLPVIRDLSLSIGAGQVVAVVGSSGSGKSLLAHGILGILPYNAAMEGEIRYDGERLTPERVETLRGREIVLVPQGVTYLDPLMKVGPQIRRGKRSPEARAKSRSVLERYGLGAETEELYPFELSGGMARRVLISTAVMETPRLVIADEPTPGLDARAAGRILGHFREIADAGAGMLLITHDLELALTIADRVVVFYAGETVEEADAADFAAGRLRHPYTRALWRALPQNGFTRSPARSRIPVRLQAGAYSPRAARIAAPRAVRRRFHTGRRTAGACAACIRRREVPHEPGSQKSVVPLPAGTAAGVAGGQSDCTSRRAGGLRGPSGRGKTTLCKLLAGYERPCGGQVLLDGRPLAGFRGCCPVQLIGQHPETAVDRWSAWGTPCMRQAPWKRRCWKRCTSPRLAGPVSHGALRRGAPAVLHRPGAPPGDPVPALRRDHRHAGLGHAGADLEFLLDVASRRDLGLLIVSHQSLLLEKLCTRIEQLDV